MQNAQLQDHPDNSNINNSSILSKKGVLASDVTKSGTTVQQSKKLPPNPESAGMEDIAELDEQLPKSMNQVSKVPLKPQQSQSVEEARWRRQQQQKARELASSLYRTVPPLERTFKGESQIAEEQEQSQVQKIIVEALESLGRFEDINENHGALFQSNIVDVPFYYLSRQS